MKSKWQTQEAQARLVWQSLLDLLFSQKERFAAALAQFELNPPQAHLLRVLQPDVPLPMCRLAGSLGCDASNVTNLVDRLEARGLIERRPDPADRRIKNIALTDAGTRLREDVLLQAFAPPAALASLPVETLTSLADVLRHIAAEVQTDDCD